MTADENRLTRTSSRFPRPIERSDNADFPFYDGCPIGISTGRWFTMWFGCLVAFLVLVLPSLPGAFGVITQVSYTAILLAFLVWGAGRHWTAIFRPVRLRDVGLMVVFAIAGTVIAAVVALSVRAVFSVAANPASGGPVGGAGQALVSWLGDATQLVGEELMTIIPFLALLHVLTSRANMSRRSAIAWAALITTLWFGALHLPTYDWNVAQSLIVIGAGRLVLTLAYIRTKNLWVPVGAHIIFDTIGLFLIPMLPTAGSG